MPIIEEENDSEVSQNKSSSDVSMKLTDTDHAPSIKVPTPRKGKPKQKVKRPTMLQALQHKKYVANST